MSTVAVLLERDLLVARRNLRLLLTSATTQPILLSVLFGTLMPKLRLVTPEYGAIFVPGLVGITILVAGAHGVLGPLAADLAGTREVDERLLAPVSVRAVAFGKIVAGGIQSALVGLIALPVIVLIVRLGGQPVSLPSTLFFVPLLMLSGLLSAAFGLVLGCLTEPRHGGLVFAVAIGPMMMFGCAYYPWLSLAELGPFRYLFLLNPLVFICEAMRLCITPQLGSMAPGLLIPGLLASCAVFMVLGWRVFDRRTIL